MALVLLAAPPAAGTGARPAGLGDSPATWRWPLPGRPEVVRPFAPGPTRYSAGHYGADLAGAAGAPVLAAGSGRVSFAGLVAGRGVVVLEHPGTGLRTSYEPLDVLVALGEEVAGGDVLGLLEPLGHACPTAGACLHWGLRRGQGGAAAYLDPIRLLVRPVRLLPGSGWTGPAPALSRSAVRPALRIPAPAPGPRASALAVEVVGALRLLLPVTGLLLPGPSG